MADDESLRCTSLIYGSQLFKGSLDLFMKQITSTDETRNSYTAITKNNLKFEVLIKLAY